jgi:hypothetical protein
MKRNILYVIYLIATVSAMLSLVEFSSHLLLTAKESNKTVAKGNFFDPHLGYAYPDFGPKVDTLESRGHKFLKGFVLYHNDSSSLPELGHPIILILGGSTSEPFIEPRSWPEHLADLMRDKGQQGQVINGAVAGYTSSQELIKLVRDGLEFSPDVIISYGSLRDREAISPLPFPMVPQYQRTTVEALAKKRFPLMKNTMALLFGTYNRGYTFGLPTANNHAQAWIRNMRIMKSVANEFGSGFCAIMQPLATNQTVGNANIPRGEEFISTRRAQIQESRGEKFIVNLTNLLDRYENIYSRGVYPTDEGNKIIAKRVYGLIFEEKTCMPDEGIDTSLNAHPLQ